MNIGLLAPPWLTVPPAGYGGTELVLDLLARGLQAAGHDVLLFTVGASTCPVPRAFLLDAPERARLGQAVVELRHVVHGYEALKGCDIVHDHTLVGTVYALRFPRLQVVTTNHGPFDAELNDLYRAVSGQVPVIAISRAQAAQADPGVRVAGVVHHGIDVAEVAFRSGDGGYHLFLGRMTPDKGPKEAALAARQAGVRLLIAAKMEEPAERAYFREEVQPLLSDRIEYVGEADSDGKRRLLAGARSLVNPISWAEPFGLVMLEALAHGTPVITTAWGAAPEIVDHGVTGFVCDSLDGIVAALHAVETIDRAACRAAVKERFSVERMVAGHVRIYERLLAS
jgi:glycosyltransferase involved in cell wall biosynthesis